MRSALTSRELLEHSTEKFGGYFVKCDRCDGTGFVSFHVSRLGISMQRLDECPKCDTTGRIWIRTLSFRQVAVRNMFRVLVIATIIGIVVWYFAF